MSKRRAVTTHRPAAKVKKRRGVGSRTITVLDSDEDSLPTTTGEFARVTKTRVGTSGKAERVVMGCIPIVEVEEVDVHAPLEENADAPMGTVTVTKNIVRKVPAKRQRKKANDSVSVLTFQTLWRC